MPIDAAQIERLGWRQGSIFTLAASRPLVVANRAQIAVPGYEIPDDSRLLLVSHDCDVVHRGAHEPRIEVCPAVPLRGVLDGNFTGTRNPRRLHIELVVDGATVGFELRAPTRFTVSREVLQEVAPDTNASISARHRSYFLHWLAKRVRRSALPTEFDRRIDSDTRAQIRTALRPLGDLVDSLLIAINPDNVELAPEQPYVAQIVALMESDNFAAQQRRAIVDAAVQRLQTLIDICPGIELDACVSQSMGEMTIDVYRQFSIWDYDEMSLAEGVEPPHLVP